MNTCRRLDCHSLVTPVFSNAAAATNSQRNLMIGTTVILAAAVLLAFLLGRGLSRPLTAITAVMNRLSSGDTAVTIPGGDRKDELGSMAATGDVLRRKDGSIPALVHAHPNETVADAAHYLREFHVSQMPVVRAEPPVMAAEVAGAVVERDLLDALFTGRAQLSDRLEQHMSAPLPTIGANEPLNTAMSAFASADAALVLVDGKPAGVVTRSDVLAFLGS